MLISFLPLCLLAFTYVCDGYRILAVFPLPGRSHGILGYEIVKLLLEAGHEVTYITSHVEKNSHPKLRQVNLSSNAFPDDFLNIKVLMDNKDSMDYTGISYMMSYVHIKTIEHEDVQKILRDPKEHFDAVIIDWLFTELCVGYAAVFDTSMIWLSTIEPHWQILRLIDEGLSPAYNGDPLTVNIPPFNFMKRIEELWIQIRTKYYMYMYVDSSERDMYERLIAPIIRQRGREPAPFDELKYNASMVLGNSHVALGQATRIPQNYKPIGGYHIDPVVKPLPEDLQKIFDNAPNGVIYFSMGSNLKSKDMPEQLKKDILKVFSGLKQTVLWKFEEEFHDLPRNVHVVKWAPQQSILAQPNCRIFITHGGFLSSTEAVHFGVPTIGVPVYGDQFVNVDMAVSKGYAKRVDLSYAMATDLEAAIQDILTDTRYRNRVKELSLIYHDRPVHPRKEIVHWVEHVIRTRGAQHLRSPALMVPWYQKMYLDLAAVVILSVILFLFLLNSVRVYLFSPKSVSKKKKN